MISVKKSLKIFTMLFLLLLLTGCVRMPATKIDAIDNHAKLLVMPPHDVLQYGAPHVAGEGSGRYFQNAIINELNSISTYNVVAYDSNDNFNHITRIDREEAILESQRLGFDYCLLLNLGEFQNAAPFTFRPDYVTLRDGVLIDVKRKVDVWFLNKPFKRAKSNIGSYHMLMNQIAKFTAESIVR